MTTAAAGDGGRPPEGEGRSEVKAGSHTDRSGPVQQLNLEHNFQMFVEFSRCAFNNLRQLIN